MLCKFCTYLLTYLSAPRFITYSDACKLSADIARKSWQRKWNQEIAGSYTRQLIPEVGVKVCFPEKRYIGISYCCLLLHNTMLEEDTYHCGLSQTPVCECSLEREAANHFLLHCSRYQDARNELQESLMHIHDYSSRKRCLHLTDSLLLALQCDGVTREDQRCIKEALFQFITETRKKL